MTQVQRPVTDNGENEKLEAELPIDIDYTKFLQWLIDRHRVPRKWHTHLKAARALARTAYTSTPPSELSKLSQFLPKTLSPHDVLSYHSVREAADNSKDAHTDTDLLGRRRKGPWEIARAAFEKEDIFLADAALLLVRLSDVEAPALKKRINVLSAESQELQRREVSTAKGAEEADERFKLVRQMYGIGDSDRHHVEVYEKKVRDFVKREVPNVLKGAAEAARALVAAVECYEEFAQFVTDGGGEFKRCETVRNVANTDVDDVVKLKRGNANVVENGDGIDWKIEVKGTGATVDTSDVGGDGIDWGIEIDDTGINTGEAGENSEGKNRDTSIDWRIPVDGNGEGTTPTENDSSTTVGNDWGIEVKDDMTSKTTKEEEEEVEYTNGTTLADNDTREAFLDDVGELEAFLERRLEEVQQESSIGSGAGMEVTSEVMRSMPDSIREVREKEIRAMLENVDRARESLSGDNAKHVLSLQESGNGEKGRGLEKCVKGMMQRYAAKDRAVKNLDSVREGRRIVGGELKEVGDELRRIGQVAKVVIEMSEQTVSNLCDGRDVHMLGDVRKLVSWSTPTANT